MEQSKLGFEHMTGPREFTREGVLDAVAKLVATDDQVRYTIWMNTLKPDTTFFSPWHWPAKQRFEIAWLQCDQDPLTKTCPAHMM